MRLEKNPTVPKRPLSPHLEIYRLPLTALISISHRITGVILIVGFLFLTALLVLASLNAVLFDEITPSLRSRPFEAATVLFKISLGLHLVHGIRHLLWDLGYGFDRGRQTRLALFEISATVLVSLALIFTPEMGRGVL